MTAVLSHPDQLKELLGIPFNREQMAAVGAPLEPAVIVAGAGSGKTTVMAARVVWLVGSGAVRPEEVLGLTFTNKAAGELSERVRASLLRAGAVDRDAAEPLGDPEISTYHAFAGRLLKEHGLRIGIEPDVRLLADATRFQLAAKVLRTARGPFPALTGTFANLVADLTALDGELAEHLVEPQTLREFDERLLDTLATVKLTNDDLRAVPATARARLELLRLVEDYRRRKRSAGLMDFGDQIAAAARLAQQRPEVGELLRGQFKVVLLDEYQDTSVAQRLMLAGLFGAGPDGTGSGHPVTAVGDPCQAIYGWRGASVANLDEFPRHFPKADGRPAGRYALSENRRSGGRLLAFANVLAAPLREMHEGVEALRPAPGAEQDGFVRAALLPTHAEEIDWLADSIAHLVRTGTAPGRIAVLCRGGAAFPDIHAALVAREVPVEVVGLGGLLQLPEVADLVAVCEVLQDPTANAALVRLLIGPRWRIGPRDLALLGRRAAELVRTDRAEGVEALAAAVAEADPTEVVSLADAVETFLDGDQPDELPFSAEARVRFARLAAELRELRRSLADPLMDVLHRVLSVTGLEVELTASPQALAARRRETLHAFLDVAASFSDLDGDPGLAAFLGFLRAAQQYERGLDSSLPGGEDTVKVLTAHKSKGLEWDVVAVPGLVRGAFPSSSPRERWTSTKRVLPHALRGDADTLPDVRGEWNGKSMTAFRKALADHSGVEELRLGYVAFTRPRSLLLASGHWWGPSQKTARGPSAFLEQLREHCERPGAGEIERWAEQPEKGAENPALASPVERPWPLPLDPAAQHARRRVAEVVRRRLAGTPAGPPAQGGEAGPTAPGSAVPGPESMAPGSAAPGSTAPEPEPMAPEDQRQVASWDRDLTALLGELERSRRTGREVPLPAALSATQLLRLAADPDGFAHDLARPMPRPPQPAARRGTRFHAWVQSRIEPLLLIEPGALPGADDDGIEDEQDLERLKEAFLRTPYAQRKPHRVEVPFQLVLAGRVVRGRIDAVYREDDALSESGGASRYEVVDWKTHREETADPLQLAVYRLAWAEHAGVDPEQVAASFLYVRSGRIVRPAGLPDRKELERLLIGNSDY
ncbi:UvrD-helicase domain-containing protein [Streptomyces sp. CBMA156]|uniref:UvrD-helicase domain-containing protein n=2 Tax=Streptomyces sp. CBMA156 TaxID=1930280 RepID=UPI0016620782|nr:UvrD-helicase domain-containing protein [Streptomyces sp. CBMA156]MBD0672450.1 ATP-dependent DNA helicase [Streptomyces sp. CBMA156]